MPPKLEVRNAADGSNRPEILVYGAIGDDYDGITAKMFAEKLAPLGNAAEIGVRINSHGGYVADGFAIYNLLKSHPADIIVDVDAFALSAASTIAMAGDTIRMHENSVMMIHKPAGLVWGDAATMRKEAEVLDLLQGQIAGIYAARTGKPLDQINPLIDAETWMTAAECLDMGFCNEVVPNAAETPVPASPDENPDEPEPFGNGAPLALGWKNVPDWAKSRLNLGKQRPAGVVAWRRNLLRRRLALREKENS